MDRKLTRRQFGKALGLGLGTAVLAPLAADRLPGGAGDLLVPRAAAAGRPGITLDPTLPVHPALQYGAQAEPDKVVRVIVQKRQAGADGRAIAAAHGATHLEEFPFIKSHVFELPQRAVPRLGLDPHVLYVSPDGPVQRHAIATANLKTTYPFTTGAALAWNNQSLPVTGVGVGVAILDTGINGHPDLPRAGVTAVKVNSSTTNMSDKHGHGTHVAGIIRGQNPSGYYLGVAPGCNLVSVKIADDQGMAHASDLLRGLQWCYDNRATYGLRVVNLSITAGTPESYKTSPVCAAVEQLWLNGVVVVVAAGNRGAASDATWYPPANDPYVITVGALDEAGTWWSYDDSLAPFSSRGPTQDNVAKPDLVAPGRRIVSSLASTGSTLATMFPDRVSPDGLYVRLSGTSMAAPVVVGVVALTLEAFPALAPDQVKWLLTRTASRYPGQADGAGAVSALSALNYANNNDVPRANQGLTPNTGISPTTNTVTWGANGYWDTAYWDTAYWDTAYWDVSTSYD